jgi:hypothetical protein
MPSVFSREEGDGRHELSGRVTKRGGMGSERPQDPRSGMRLADPDVR